MPAEFQKAVDLTLTNCTKTYAYLDDILVVTKGNKELHQQKLKTVLEKLDEENLAILPEKCKFACKEIEWLGFNINSEGTAPLIKKTEAIEKLSTKNFSTIKKFYGVNTLSHKIYTKINTNSCSAPSIAKKHRKEKTT